MEKNLKIEKIVIASLFDGGRILSSQMEKN
jgi:hypothetical protein